MRIKFQNYKGACLLLMTIVSSISIFADTPNWKDAQWIWQQEDGPSNTWVAFRKLFKLNETLNQVLVKIAVNTKYW